MLGNKYSETLTIILIVVIVAIIGLLIFFGIDVYRKFYIETAAGEAFVFSFVRCWNRRVTVRRRSVVQGILQVVVHKYIDSFPKKQYPPPQCADNRENRYICSIIRLINRANSS